MELQLLQVNEEQVYDTVVKEILSFLYCHGTH